MKTTGRSTTDSSSTKYETGRLSAVASFIRVAMVGTMPLRSSLWIAAAETSERSASCCSESPFCWRSSRIFGPRLPMIRPSSSAAVAGTAPSALFMPLVCLLR